METLLTKLNISNLTVVKSLKNIIEWVMLSKYLLGADFAKYVKQMQC